MTRGRTLELWGSRAGMELCWRYAWADYTIGALTQRPFPLPQGVAAFLLAAVLTRLARGRGWRMGTILLLHALGLAAGALWVVHGAYGVEAPWWDPDWVRPFLDAQKTLEGGLILALVLFWAGVFWHGGLSLARSPSTHLAVCTRLDLGIAAFLALYLLRWLVRSQSGVETGGLGPELLLVPYLVFGLFAVGLARSPERPQGEVLSGPAGIGPVFSVLVATTFLGAAVAILFLPYLTAAARAGYAVMRTAAAPLGPPLLELLRFLLLGRRAGTAGSGAGSSGAGMTGTASPRTGGWVEWVAAVLSWGLVGLLGALAVAAAGVVLWRLARWLLSRAPAERTGRALWADLAQWFAGAWAAVRGRLRRARPGDRVPGAVALYAALCGWGRRSGVPAAAHDTPLEFGRRLERRFPAAKEEIAQIVELFHREVYAGRRCGPAALAPGRRSWRRLRSPSLWPGRLRSRWFPRAEIPVASELCYADPAARAGAAPDPARTPEERS